MVRKKTGKTLFVAMKAGVFEDNNNNNMNKNVNEHAILNARESQSYTTE